MESNIEHKGIHSPNKPCTTNIVWDHWDIKEEVQGVTMTNILIHIRVINSNSLWRDTADGKAKISANIKIWSAGAFVSVTLNQTLHL